MATGKDQGKGERKKLNHVYTVKRQVTKELDGIQKSMMFSSQRIDYLTRHIYMMNEELQEERENLQRMKDEYQRIGYQATRNGLTG